jgi:hypothetical protein
MTDTLEKKYNETQIKFVLVNMQGEHLVYRFTRSAALD